jgi:hypothetical protein
MRRRNKRKRLLLYGGRREAGVWVKIPTGWQFNYEGRGKSSSNDFKGEIEGSKGGGGIDGCC